MPPFPICSTHKRRSYPSEEAGIHAALMSSIRFGKPFRMYECKSGKTVQFHITRLVKNRGVSNGA